MKAFQPQGNTQVIAGNATAPAGVRVLADGDIKATWYRLFNPDSVTAWYAYGDSAGSAKAAATIPVAATPAHSMGLPSLSVEIICAPPGAYFSAITASGNANVQVTPGDGF